MKLNTIQILILCTVHLTLSVKINFLGLKSPEVITQATPIFHNTEKTVNTPQIKDSLAQTFVKPKIIASLNSDFLTRDEEDLKKFYINLKTNVSVDDLPVIKTSSNAVLPKNNVSQSKSASVQSNTNGINNKNLFYTNFLNNFQRINTEFEAFIDKSNRLSQKLSNLTEKNINYSQEISKLKNSRNIKNKTRSSFQLNYGLNNSTIAYSNHTINTTLVDKEILNQTNTNITSKNSEAILAYKMINQTQGINDKRSSEVIEEKSSLQPSLTDSIVIQALDNHKEMQELATISSNLKKSIANIQDFHKSFNDNFNDFEEVFAEKNLQDTKKKYESSLLFYNSLSLVMLAMLAGGLVGVIFILYFSFHNEVKT